MRHGGLAARVPVVGPLVGLFLADTDVVDFRRARAAVQAGDYPAFFHAMLERGVALAPGPYEALFPGMAHGDDVLASVVEVAGEAAASVAKRR